MSKRNLFLKAFRFAAPIMSAYVPFAFAAGILFQTLGYSWVYAGLCGLFIYSGALQFLAVGLLATHSGLPQIFLAALALNVRHMFYGFSFLSRYRHLGVEKVYLIHTLTDETYSVLTTHKESDPDRDIAFCFAVSALNQLAWVSGCFGGAWLANVSKINTKGFDFVLLAVFICLLVDQIRNIKKFFPILFAIFAAALAWVLLPSQFLAVGFSISLILILIRYRIERKPQ